MLEEDGIAAPAPPPAVELAVGDGRFAVNAMARPHQIEGLRAFAAHIDEAVTSCDGMADLIQRATGEVRGAGGQRTLPVGNNVAGADCVHDCVLEALERESSCSYPEVARSLLPGRDGVMYGAPAELRAAVHSFAPREIAGGRAASFHSLRQVPSGAPNRRQPCSRSSVVRRR